MKKLNKGKNKKQSKLVTLSYKNNHGFYLLKSVILMKENTWVTSLRMKKDGTWTSKF